MKTKPIINFIPDSAKHDRDAEHLAKGNGTFDGVPDSTLVHAARYEGHGWSPERRAAIIAEFKRRNGL